MAKKGRKYKDPERDLKKLEHFVKKRRRELKKSERELLLCLKKCLKKLDDPPWHYGPRCPTGGGGGGG